MISRKDENFKIHRWNAKTRLEEIAKTNQQMYIGGRRLTMVVVIWMMMLLVGVLRRWVT